MRLSDIQDFVQTLAVHGPYNFRNFRKQFARTKTERRRREEEASVASLQLKGHFPLAKLPDELLELIFRYIICNYSLEVFRKLLENVPELRSKVLVVTDTNKESAASLRLSRTGDVPNVDIRDYERSLTLRSRQQPLIVFFSFCSYHLETPEMATYLTRFLEDSPYFNMINKKSFVLFRTTNFHSGDLHPDHNAFKYLSGLVKLKAGSTMLDSAALGYPFPAAAHLFVRPEIVVLSISPQKLYTTRPSPRAPGGYSRPQTSYAFKENSGIQFHFEQNRYGKSTDRVMVLSNIETELRYSASEQSGEILSWTTPYFQRPRSLRVLMNQSCAPRRDTFMTNPPRCVERKVELGKTTGYDNLHIEFLSPKMPLIIDNSDELISDGWLTARNLIIDKPQLDL